MKKLYIIMNCLLNMNTRAPGISIHPGPIREVFDRLINSDYEILQVPCPEATHIGLKRWWFTKDMYDSVPFREHSKRISQAIANIAYRYHLDGYEIIVVGLSLSPSCGVFYTQSDPSWEGKPFDVKLEPPVINGSGVFIEELEKALQEKKIRYKKIEVPPSIIYPKYRVPELPRYSVNYEESVNRLIKEMGLA